MWEVAMYKYLVLIQGFGVFIFLTTFNPTLHVNTNICNLYSFSHIQNSLVNLNAIYVVI